MAKAKGSTNKKSTSKSNEKLLAALNFISVAQKNEADIPYKTHCIIKNNRICATNGILSAGAYVEENIEANPHTFKLLKGLQSCSKDLSMTVDENNITIKSGSLSAKIVNYSGDMPTIEPDSPYASIGEEIRQGFELVAPFVTENAKKVILSSVMLRSGSVVSTNGLSILEFWHGHSKFPTIVLPKSFVGAIINIDKIIESIGFSDKSCTIFFNDKSWLKTQLQAEPYPDVDRILSVASNQQSLPINFYEALKALESFSDSGNVYFEKDCLQSHRNKIEGAVYETPGISHGPCFNIKELRRVEKVIRTVDFYSHNAAFYFGDNLRGAIIGVKA